ncbi:hypothetical protein B0H14DRAFT_2581182 [Mycena olivaceomarginata]|nr:hypothetical protein B0H14DRAFT_2581182 [Mycena olivaceomarginata]
MRATNPIASVSPELACPYQVHTNSVAVREDSVKIGHLNGASCADDANLDEISTLRFHSAHFNLLNIQDICPYLHALSCSVTLAPSLNLLNEVRYSHVLPLQFITTTSFIRPTPATQLPTAMAGLNVARGLYSFLSGIGHVLQKPCSIGVHFLAGQRNSARLTEVFILARPQGLIFRQTRCLDCRWLVIPTRPHLAFNLYLSFLGPARGGINPRLGCAQTPSAVGTRAQDSETTLIKLACVKVNPKVFMAPRQVQAYVCIPDVVSMTTEVVGIYPQQYRDRMYWNEICPVFNPLHDDLGNITAQSEMKVKGM